MDFVSSTFVDDNNITCTCGYWGEKKKKKFGQLYNPFMFPIKQWVGDGNWTLPFNHFQTHTYTNNPTFAKGKKT